MSRDDSQFTGIPPSLGDGRSNNRVQLSNFIIFPDNRRYRAWEIFLAALVFYTAWVSPFEFGFLEKPERPLSIIDNIVNGFFAMNIVLTFFVAYLDRSMDILVDNHKQIAWRYTSTWLLFDVVSTIPSEIAGKVSIGSLQSYRLFNMFRLWRLHRVKALFARLEKNRNFNYFWVRLTWLIFVTLFATHCAGCFYYRLAANYHDPGRTWIGYGNMHFKDRSLGVRFVTSMYWSVTALVGVGTLDAQNRHEMIFIICYMLFNLGLTAYLIGNLTILAVHATINTRKFRDTIQMALSFAQRNQLPDQLQDQTLAYFSLKFRTDSEGLQQETIDALPKAIRSKIAVSRFKSHLDKAYLFSDVSNESLVQLVSEGKAEAYPPKADVILQNEAPTDFYLVVKGAVELLVMKNGEEQVVGEAKPGDLCGEIGVLCNRPQCFRVRTRLLSRLLRLNRTTFLNIVQANISDGTAIVNNLLQRMQGMDDPVIGKVFLKTEKMLARGRTDLPVGLCFATLRGYEMLLRKLLEKGLDPDEADNNGRTALHIAAARGSETCVRLLLDHDADPNCTDLKGNVPLWEAILGKHETVVKLLIDKNASLSSGDVGQFSCIAAEKNNLNLLKQIIHHRGDVTRAKNDGSTALHVAVCEGNIELVKFLLDQGANIYQQDHHGCTPWDLADQQGDEDIINLFLRPQPLISIFVDKHAQER